MVYFVSEQGLSDFGIGGLVNYFEDFERAKTPLRDKIGHLWMGTYELTPGFTNNKAGRKTHEKGQNRLLVTVNWICCIGRPPE
jgi:hypothetical protein